MNKLIKTISYFLISLLPFCSVSAAQQSDSSSKRMPPKAYMTAPDKLLTQWGDTPIPLSEYSAEELKLQKYINEKTADAVATYSTKAQEGEWTKYDREEITPYTWKVLDLRLTESNGKTFDVSLLRPHWWIKSLKAGKVGNRFYLKIPEVVEGWQLSKLSVSISLIPDYGMRQEMATLYTDR